jgi:RecA-family ATPase
MYNVVEHARNYVKAMPESISGSGGHNDTYAVATVLVQGFDLQFSDAMAILQEYNVTKCFPQWTERELTHKLRSAESASPPNGKRGSMRAEKSMDAPKVKGKYKIPTKKPTTKEFFEALYNPDDVIHFCSVQKLDGRAQPNLNRWVKVKDLVRDSKKYAHLFKCEEGTWMRVNPIGENKQSDKDVTKFKYCLVESDVIPKEDQLKRLEESGLPIAALIDSGGKSIHAYVNVDAENITEYHKRREELWNSLPEFNIDEANKNPSRFARFPNAIRGNKTQELISLRVGPKSYEAWKEERKEIEDDGFPPITTFNELVAENLKEPEQIIKNIIDRGSKLSFIGSSKSGKTWTLMDIATCVSQGLPFWGQETQKSKVLFVDFELKPIRFQQRFMAIHNARGIRPNDNLHRWNLRGKAGAFEKIKPILLNRIKNENYGMLILDPIYKLYGNRDENSNGDIADLMNEITDVAESMNVTIVMSMHTTKGCQRGKPVIERAAGAGSFGRDPDAALTIEETLDEDGNMLDKWDVLTSLRDFKEPVLSKIYRPYGIPIYDPFIGKYKVRDFNEDRDNGVLK